MPRSKKNYIYPALWFNGNAKEAAGFYCSVFSDSEIKADSEHAIMFESSDEKFLCINGGPDFIPNPSISFFVIFDDKKELDTAWEKLIENGKVLMPLDQYDWSPRYGWLQDKYHISWQLALEKIENVGQVFTPSLLFTGEQNGKAEEAVNHYTSIFNQSNIVGIHKYSGDGDDIKGNVAHAQFTLNGKVLMAMDSSHAHQFGFSEGISLVVECSSQEEIDYLWEKLSAIPEAEQCGWLKDKYGVSWQIIPDSLNDMMSNTQKAGRVTEAFMKMKKLNIRELEEAFRD